MILEGAIAARHSEQNNKIEAAEPEMRITNAPVRFKRDKRGLADRFLVCACRHRRGLALFDITQCSINPNECNSSILDYQWFHFKTSSSTS